MQRDVLTLQEAADELDVHYMTVYRYVRLGQLPAHKEGASWRIWSTDLQSFQQEKASESSHSVSRGNVDWSSRFESRLVEGDQTGAWNVIESALASGMEPLDVYTEMMVPALVSIGRRWADGELSIADEHVASALAGRLIGRLGPRFTRRGRSKGTVAVAAPAGDRHSLGLAMISDALRAGGYTVLDLGADTPLETWEGVLRDTERLKGVCIGVANPGSRDAAAAMASLTRSLLGDNVAIVMGGSAIASHEDARGLGADRSAGVADVAGAIAG